MTGLGLVVLVCSFILQLMLHAEDFKDLGIPLGPKKKLLEFIEKEKVNRSQLKVHTHMHTHIHMHTHTHTCTHIHTHTRTHAHTYTHAYTYTHMHTHAHTYTHAHIYTHAHTPTQCTHTHTPHTHPEVDVRVV